MRTRRKDTMDNNHHFMDDHIFLIGFGWRKIDSISSYLKLHFRYFLLHTWTSGPFTNFFCFDLLFTFILINLRF